MKAIYLTLFSLTLHFSVLSQGTDTCDYISQNNEIGGLDCAIVSLAPYTADSYQWVNCDSLFTPLPNETSHDYLGVNSAHNVALVVNAVGCIDTSECYPVCFWGLDELPTALNQSELLGIIDLLGRGIDSQFNTVQIYLYSDGRREKIVRVE